VLSSLEQIIQFDFLQPLQIDLVDGRTVSSSRISIVGAHTYPKGQIRLGGKIQSFGIFFEPFGIWQLFRIPKAELTDRFYEADDLLGRDIQQLWLALAECETFPQRVVLVEEYLLERAASASGQTPIMKAASHLFRQRGKVRIRQLAAGVGLSMRQFERRFGECTGIGPKHFARVARFQMAVDSKLSAPERTWLSIAHDLGYHDQMHMIRDFHALGGASPSSVLGELGDMRPPALAASNPVPA
jgi:AraC-like DNA-binding protein